MKSHIKMTFMTKAGKDLVLTVADANEAVTSETVNAAMAKILSANAVAGVAEITRKKSAALYKAESRIFTVA